jgi:hypothetical protein
MCLTGLFGSSSAAKSRKLGFEADPIRQLLFLGLTSTLRASITSLSLTARPSALEIDEYGIVNLRLSWRKIFNWKLDASPEVRNLIDNNCYVGGLAEGSDVGVDSFVPGRPRWLIGKLRYNSSNS